jgi:hypothetical protein
MFALGHVQLLSLGFKANHASVFKASRLRLGIPVLLLFLLLLVNGVA